MNGSGKSALFEIMYRIVNNFSCLLERDLKRNASENLCFVEGLWADLYYVINGDLYCISCRNTNVKLLRNGKDLLDLFVNYTKKEEYDPLSQQKLTAFTQNLFYSIVTNYSMQSFVCTDFRGEPAVQVLKNGKSQQKDGLLWLSGLFHKNDGYITPIVLNPFRALFIDCHFVPPYFFVYADMSILFSLSGAMLDRTAHSILPPSALQGM